MSDLSPPTVSFGDINVGDGHPTVVVAEIGTFYNRDMGLAREYLARAVETGAPVLKTEILHDSDICLRNTGLVHDYKHTSGRTSEDYRALIERKTVPLRDYEMLVEVIHDLGLPYLASVYDFAGVDFLARHGACAVKLSRAHVDNVPLIRKAAQSGLPIVFDAGNVYFSEIAAAVELARREGAAGVIVNHHPGSNPAPAAAHNLSRIPMYKSALGVPAGLSCHYRGDEILYAAVGIGANLLEKGVDIDPDRSEQDVVSAASFESLEEAVRKVRACWEAIGKSNWNPDEPRNLDNRYALFARREIAAGDVFTEENTGFAFPPIGISVASWDELIGRTAKRKLARGQSVFWNDVSD